MGCSAGRKWDGILRATGPKKKARPAFAERAWYFRSGLAYLGQPRLLMLSGAV